MNIVTFTKKNKKKQTNKKQQQQKQQNFTDQGSDHFALWTMGRSDRFNIGLTRNECYQTFYK